MQSWRLRFLSIDSILEWPSDPEIEHFFTLTASEIATIQARRNYYAFLQNNQIEKRHAQYW